MVGEATYFSCRAVVLRFKIIAAMLAIASLPPCFSEKHVLAQVSDSECGPFPQMSDYGFKTFTGDGSTLGEKMYMKDKRLWMDCQRSLQDQKVKNASSSSSRKPASKNNFQMCSSFVIANGVKKCL
jgi:hypothetical protein